TMRMLAGILAGQPFRSVMVGNASLSRRPMKRVADPLSRMGARIKSQQGGLPPLEIEGGALQPIRYEMPVASAQVKSAVLLAGLFAEGETEVIEKVRTRDHTEIALEQMGADIGRHQRTIAVRGRAHMEGKKLYVPGDFSSAAFFIVAALVTPHSNLMLHNMGLNPTRTGILDVLVPMGGRVKVVNLEMMNGELIGDLHVEASQLRGGEIPESAIPGLIEELPDGLRVAGRKTLRGAEIDPHDDHRIAMAFAVAGLVAQGHTIIKNSGCVDISFPDFFATLAKATE